jgi:hypothetical protein
MNLRSTLAVAVALSLLPLTAKTALRRGGPGTLNIYTVDASPWLGWGIPPRSSIRPTRIDGVVVDWRSLHGDYVADTPSEQSPAFNCPVGRNTCGGTAHPGLDPITNFMDYTQDSCMYAFTAGQSERMQAAWAAFRD